MLVLRILLCLTLCLFAASPALAGAKKVVASVLPVYVFALNVAGERAEVSLLMKSGTDPHGFALRPSDVKTLDGADLVLLNGAGLEKNILRGIDADKAVDTSSGIEILRSGRAPDPHVWLDPLNARVQVENIADALSSVDPEGEEYYRSNAAAYAEKLSALDGEIRDGVEKLAGARLITYHESFNYFARRYGLAAFSLTGPDAEAPLPRRVKAVYDIVREEGVAAVFEEAQFRAGALERIAHDLGVRVCTLNPLVSGEPSPDLYERAMRENLKTIIDCLGSR